MVVIRRPWTRQPQGPVQIDRANPLGAKVITHIPLRPGSRGAKGEVLTRGSSGTFFAGPKGYGLKSDGVAGAGSVPVDLSAYTSFTLAFWMYWDANASDDHFGWEHGPNWNTTKGFSIQPNESSSGLFVFGSSQGDSTSYWAHGFTRPVQAKWHRVCLSLDRATPSNLAWIDGVPQTLTNVLVTGGLTGNFTSDTLHLFSRNEASLFGAGKIQDLTFYRGALSNVEAKADYQNPWQVLQPSRLIVAPPLSSGVTGTLAKTNANDTSAASGTTTVTGTLARTNNNDTSSASGTTTVTGSLARTNANDTSAASGTTTVQGSLARTNANDTSSASGTTTVVGSLAKTNANDAATAAGTTTVVGTVAASNANDTASASGSVGSAVSGSLAYTNANDTGAASGTTTVVGSSATQNANDTANASGGAVSGTVDYTNANDTSDASGDAGASGAADDYKVRKKKYVVRVGNRLVAFRDAETALQFVPHVDPKRLGKVAEQVIPLAKVKPLVSDYAKLLKEQNYAEMLAQYEDEQDIEMLLLSL